MAGSSFFVLSGRSCMRGITYDWRGFQLGLQYVDTNLSTTKCADGCDAKGIASVTYAF